MEEMSDGVAEVTGASLDDHLASFGGELGLALVLDPVRTFKLPLGGAGAATAAELPEPSLVIALKMKDDKLFNVFETMLAEHPESTKGEADGARWRSIPIPPGAPFPVTPTIARAGDYLWVTSTDVLLKQLLRAHQSQVPTLRGTDEFKRLSRGLPAQGNSFAFVSQRFSEAMLTLQTAAFGQAAGAGGPPASLMQRLMGLAATPGSYAVGWQDPDGAQSVAQGTQEPSAMLVGVAVAAPVAIMAGVTLPALSQAKGKAQEVQCMNNLKQIALGLLIYATDHDDVLPPDLKSLKEYLGGNLRVLVCPRDPAGVPASGEWSDFDFSKCSYEYLKPGLKTSEGSPATTPVARCKFHGTQAYADGHVQRP
jgi:type II secretory pathway pseudopilin PulG